MHPAIREEVWALCHRGKYDTAVFEAMKAVEVAVRDAARLAPADIGTKLMRKAFDVEKVSWLIQQPRRRNGKR